MNTIDDVREKINRSLTGNITSSAEDDLHYICECLCDVIEELEVRIRKLEGADRP